MIIAEIGLNHQGDEKRAMKILKEIVKTEIDAVTFQIREPEFYNGSKPYKYPLSTKFYYEASKLAKKNGKLFGIAIADKDKIKDLTFVDFWKTLSWDILNQKLIDKLKETSKPIFISTGTASEGDILIANESYGNNIKFIHTQLSQEAKDTNLRAIERIRKLTKKKVAFGLHCKDYHVIYPAVAFEPSDYFFYVRENTDEKFPDHDHAMWLEKVDLLAKKIKMLQTALGTGRKEEMENNLK